MDETRPHASIHTLPGDPPARGDTTRKGVEVLPLPAPQEAAARDLERFLELAPDDPGAPRARATLARLRGQR